MDKLILNVLSTCYGRGNIMKDRPSILVVDDDPNISRLEQLYLEKENYEVRLADRGDTAVEEFRKLPPDLILLDRPQEQQHPGDHGYGPRGNLRQGAVPGAGGGRLHYQTL